MMWLNALVWGSTIAIALAIIVVFYICTSSVHDENRKREIAEDLNRRYRVNTTFLPSPAATSTAATRCRSSVVTEQPTVQIPRQQSNATADTVQFERVSGAQPPLGLDTWYRSFAATGQRPVIPVQDFLSGRHRGQVE